MRLLVIGGTVFVGRHLVDVAAAAGHEVTVFHRGSSPLHRDDVEEVLGDRERDLDRLEGRRWDAVIDTCGYVPRAVEGSARALADAVDRYVFVSTVSVYAEPVVAGANEDARLHEPPSPDVEQVDGDTYGPLKVACERVAEAVLPGRVLVVRPGLVIGPHDPTGRFPYWVARIAGGGPVLVPAAHHPVQVLDARDLAALVVAACERGLVGPLNAVGPDRPIDLLGLVEAIAGAVAGPDLELVAADERYLVDAGVTPWRELPLWLGPDGDPGIMAIDARRARAAGLAYRDLAESTHDTLDWLGTRPPPPDLSRGGTVPGLPRERELPLIEEWRERQGATSGSANPPR